MIRNDGKRKRPLPTALANAKAAWHHIAANADKNAISASVYKGERTGPNGNRSYEVKDLLVEIYHGKCAYCECRCDEPDVEHYRPKKRVTALPSHPGYYWLCYEWSNLLPACHYCNSRSGKQNEFPVANEANRVSRPTILPDGQLDEAACRADCPILLNERAMLIHPEVDNPAHFFAFQSNGSIYGIDQAGRGAATIEVCNLNRDTLKKSRQAIVDELKDWLNYVILLCLEGRRSLETLRDDFRLIFNVLESKAQPESPFSLMAKYTFDHFEDLILPLLTSEQQREIVREALAAYQANN